MKFKLGLFCIVMFTIIQCKPTSQQSTSTKSETIPLIILLQENISPADLSLIKSLSVESMKRVSRSQNKWMVKFSEGQKSVEEIIQILSQDDQIIEISKLDEKNQPIQTTNTKSGKSGPVKN